MGLAEFYVGGVRGRQRTAFSVVAVGAALTLSGCAADAQRPSVSPPTVLTASPSSDGQERSVQQLYDRYLRVTQEVLREGGEGPERLQPLVSEAQYKRELDTTRRIHASGYRLVGSLSYSHFTIQHADLGAGRLQAYVCVDNTRSHLEDSGGRTIEVEKRAKTGTLLVGFTGLPETPVIDSSKSWSGSSIC